MAEKDLDITVDTALYLNGDIMQAPKIRPELFKAVLLQARTAIKATLDERYAKYSAQSANVQRGSVIAIRLNRDYEKALSPKGIDSFETQTHNVGTFFDIEDIKPKYHEYWQAVQEAELIPQAKIWPRQRTMKIMGLCLEARDTPLELVPDLDTEAEILGYKETKEQIILYQQIIDLGKANKTSEVRDLLGEYMQIAHNTTSKLKGQEYIDAQIGLLVQTAKIYLKTGQYQKCKQELQDALTYATNMGYTNVESRLLTIIKDTEIQIDNLTIK